MVLIVMSQPGCYQEFILKITLVCACIDISLDTLLYHSHSVVSFVKIIYWFLCVISPEIKACVLKWVSCGNLSKDCNKGALGSGMAEWGHAKRLILNEMMPEIVRILGQYWPF